MWRSLYLTESGLRKKGSVVYSPGDSKSNVVNLAFFEVTSARHEEVSSQKNAVSSPFRDVTSSCLADDTSSLFTKLTTLDFESPGE
jgi:hypothetical protein